jgi:hypothetical protein
VSSPEIKKFILMGLVGFLCCGNFLYVAEYIHTRSTNLPPIMRYTVPGERYEPLKPYLKGLSVVGYVTDRDNNDFWYEPKQAFFLQRAQYTLSPVFMDRERRYAYDHIIFDCEKPGCEQKDAARLGLKTVVSLENEIILMRRDAR